MITLLCLVLLVVLAVGFLSNVATNRTASATEHGIALTQSLSESVVELVKAQITEGAKSQSAAGADLGWASQPGMIRTFQVGGTPGTYYKLYSATEMVKDGSAYSVNDDVPADAGNKAVWADLNRPVLESDGTTLSYPIVSPDAVGKVEGFTCNATAAWGYAGGAASPTNNPAPMPVRWLYVLANGSMVPAVASGTGSATVAGADASPIIGRVAFWTDDDTCKVNLNTASEGTFWDVPRANTATERMFSSLQPVKQEFQRYPGHPALTSLSSVFGFWLPSPTSGTVTSGNYAALSKYYQLAPRINDTTSPNSGGTLDGTLAGTQNL
ncbi:MAG: Verru/Chthon cassette protein A, partial [Terrimicrobiaceae bacterium]